MQLRRARLCLDCEELHETNRCPVCASRAFAFLTQWVPADDRRGADDSLRAAQLEDEAPFRAAAALLPKMASVMKEL